jgi:pimeloyl-ACP methyl ester carboxylesterase
MKRLHLTIVLTLLGGVATGSQADPAGWTFHAGQPGKPAVLLIHGLAASTAHWTNPASTWSIKDAHYDHRAKVKDKEGDKGPRVGIHAIKVSPKDDDAGKKDSFWTYLVEQGYTVATWDQVPCMDSPKMPAAKCLDSDTFEPAVATAREAMTLLAQKAPDAPIALVGHSRGGLVARRLLKDAKQPGRERVKWLITLHSPHQGSSMATMGVSLQKAAKKLDNFVDVDALPEPVRAPLKKLLPDVGSAISDAIDAVVTLTGLAGARELAANGAVLKALREGEAKPAGVRVVTFGGTSPRVAEVHAWVYNGASATSTNWHADPYRVFDFPADLKLPFPEMKPGGDLLVTDESSRLPWEDKHIDHKLNHAEVLWSRTVQRQVHDELSAKR